jgi:hypothetical protein
VKEKSMEKDKTLHFETYEEAAEWFDTHDMADYEDQLIPVHIDFDVSGSQNWVELDKEIAKHLRGLAQKQHISTRALVNEFLREKIKSLG